MKVGRKNIFALMLFNIKGWDEKLPSITKMDAGPQIEKLAQTLWQNLMGVLSV